MQFRTFKDLPLDAVKSIATVKFNCVLSQSICIEINQSACLLSCQHIIIKSQLKKFVAVIKSNNYVNRIYKNYVNQL